VFALSNRVRLFGAALSAAVVLAASAGWSATVPQTERPPDPICQALYDAYIARSVKVSTHIILAASDIIVDRGRCTGFWKPVLDGLEKSKGWDDIRYVNILGQMLAQDAYAKENIERGDARNMAAVQIVCLPSTIVPELIARARKAERYPRDAYAIALVRSRDPRARAFFMERLETRDNGDNQPTTQFHSALGLAELGEPAGVEWLIANSDNVSDDVVFAWPDRVPDRKISSSCISALRRLSGQPGLNTKAEFEAWWKSTSKPWTPKDHVYLVDR
jgi:hypothetical protein